MKLYGVICVTRSRKTAIYKDLWTFEDLYEIGVPLRCLISCFSHVSLFAALMNVFIIVAHRAEFLNTVAAFVRGPACGPQRSGDSPKARKSANLARFDRRFLLNACAERSIIMIVDPFFAQRHVSDRENCPPGIHLVINPDLFRETEKDWGQ